MIEMTPVQSSNIHAVGYDLHSQTLSVQFKARGGAAAGSIYEYIAVPPEVYERFMNAPSKGGWFAANIKNHYAARRAQ